MSFISRGRQSPTQGPQYSYQRNNNQETIRNCTYSSLGVSQTRNETPFTQQLKNYLQTTCSQISVFENVFGTRKPFGCHSFEQAVVSNLFTAKQDDLTISLSQICFNCKKCLTSAPFEPTRGRNPHICSRVVYQMSIREWVRIPNLAQVDHFPQPDQFYIF